MGGLPQSGEVGAALEADQELERDHPGGYEDESGVYQELQSSHGGAGHAENALVEHEGARFDTSEIEVAQDEEGNLNLEAK